MKQSLLMMLVLFLLPVSSAAKDKFWISNKLEIGYDKAFISNQLTFDREQFVKNSAAIGLKNKLDKNVSIKTFYLLENAIKHDWKRNHILGIQFDFKLK